jgi:hypothetical protein
LFATTQQSAKLLDHHALFEGARGSKVVQVFLGDYAFLFKPASEMRSRAAVGAVVLVFAEAAWRAGLFERCVERQILFHYG